MQLNFYESGKNQEEHCGRRIKKYTETIKVSVYFLLETDFAKIQIRNDGLDTRL